MWSSLRITGVLLGMSLAGSLCAQPAAKEKDRLSDSVDRGLAFLAGQQEANGVWQLAGRGQSHAITSLAVMAYLSAGHVPGEGPYQATVEKGIKWVLSQQQPNGLFSTPSWEEMYQHGITTMMLCEVAAMSDAKTARELKPKLEKAIKLILQAQRTEGQYRGGWRYRVDSPDADLSVSGWQLLALRAARNLGCDVPAERIDHAMHFVMQCRELRSGAFTYMPGSMATSACTGTGVLALELCGKERHHSREALLGGSYLLKNPLRLDETNFFYTAYYSSQAMFQLGGNYWGVFRPNLHKVLLGSQQQNGSWLNNDPNGASYNTAMAILALTVEYRLLPIYQRDESTETPKEKK